MSEEAKPSGPQSQRTRIITCGALCIGMLLLSMVLVWLAVRLSWRHDPLQIGVYERLLEAQGYVWEDSGADDGIEGYVLRSRGKGRWAERLYVHPENGGEIELTRNLWQSTPGMCCTVKSRNAEGRRALVRVAGEFSPWLTKRIAEAETQYERTGVWVRVMAPDFDLSVTTHSLTLDSYPGEYTGMGVGRVIVRVFWKLRRLVVKA